MSNKCFYSLASVKSYLVREISTHHHFLDMFALYHQKNFGITHVQAAPDPVCLRGRTLGGNGILLEEYRQKYCDITQPKTTMVLQSNSTISQIISEGIDVLSVEVLTSSVGLSVHDYKTIKFGREGDVVIFGNADDEKKQEEDDEDVDVVEEEEEIPAAEILAPKKKRKAETDEDEEDDEDEDEEEDDDDDDDDNDENVEKIHLK